jgi:hypothetical protein
MWQTWLNVTTKPNETTFEAERRSPNANLQTALIWIVIAAVVAAVVGLLQSTMATAAAQGALPQMLAQLDLSPEERAQAQMFLNSGIFGGLGTASLASIITVPLGFLIGVGILYLVARLLGGTGEFGRYAYLNAAFQAPLGILASLLSLVPFVNCLTVFISIYQIVLTYYATKVEHQLSSGRALIVVLLPLIVVLLLMGCFFLFIVGMIASLVNGGQ